MIINVFMDFKCQNWWAGPNFGQSFVPGEGSPVFLENGFDADCTCVIGYDEGQGFMFYLGL